MDDNATKYWHKVEVGTLRDPVANYILSNSLRRNDYLKRLREGNLRAILNCAVEKTLKEFGNKSVMLSGEDEAQLLAMLIKLMGAKKAIEIGVFTGYSLLNIALALPQDGKVVGLDVSSDYFKVGKPFIEEAGVFHKVDLRIQPAEKSLDELLEAGEGGTFDFAFIDADKVNYDSYYEKALQLVRPGGLIAIDNVLYFGYVLEPEKHGDNPKAIHQLNEKIHKDTRVEICMLSISDGVTLCRKV